MMIPTRRPDAVACLKGNEEDPGITGTVKFYRTGHGVMLTAEVDGLPKTSETGFFAFHIHEGGDCRGRGFPDTGGHYDPEDQPHPRHAGDLPPLLSCNGKAQLAVLTDRFCLSDVIGRTVIIHSGPDDFHTQPAGNPGVKIACGVIKRS